MGPKRKMNDLVRPKGGGRAEKNASLLNEKDDEFIPKKLSRDFEFDFDGGVTDFELCLHGKTKEESENGELPEDTGNHSTCGSDEAQEEAGSSDCEDEAETSSEDSKGSIHDISKVYFAEDDVNDVCTSFTSYNLCRPIVVSLSRLGFRKPTPIQERAIPIALRGRDICASAETGSGKTAAFVIPIMERLAYRDRSKNTTRVLILVPTRELGIQCQKFVDNIGHPLGVKSVLCIGGTNVRLQEAELRSKPDIVIATPGRLIDNLKNCMSFNLDMIEILVLDEADRMLDEGFCEELGEIIKEVPVDRQTLLFSATMTDRVEDLIRLSLKKPVKLFVDSSSTIVRTLEQEFVRIRNTTQDLKPAMLLSLCENTLKSSVVVFFNEKHTVKWMKILFDLRKISSVEFHGDLPQEKRNEALEGFKKRKFSFLLCTDIAARGLDMIRVKAVVNYDMPKTYTQYIHRVGRTARAGHSGRSVSFIADKDRSMVKSIMKNSPSQVKQRIIDPVLVKNINSFLKTQNDQINEKLENIKFNKQIDFLESEIRSLSNTITNKSHTPDAPREWYKKSKRKKNPIVDKNPVSGRQKNKISSQKNKMRPQKKSRKKSK